MTIKKCKNCKNNYWFGDYALSICKIDKEIITDESECRFMCFGKSDEKSPKKSFLKRKIRIDELGRIKIPSDMVQRVGIVDGDILRITATTSCIVIEKDE